MKPQHTLGPWHVGRGYDRDDHEFGIWDDVNRNIAVLRDFDKEQTGANARMICAAVNAHEELLEALKVCQVRVFMAEGCSPAYEQARVAIDRAIGKKVMP